jgi:hypothetical protein
MNEIPRPEIVANSPIHSPYYKNAVEMAKQQAPEQAQAIETVLGAVDKQGVDNIGVFSSQRFPGVRFPYTTVDLSAALGKKSETTDKPKRQVTYVMFPGVAIPPAGHPFTAWDMVYDRVFSELPKAANPDTNVTIISLGSPNSLWGTVSATWITELKDQNLAPYGKLYAEFLQDKLPTPADNPNPTDNRLKSKAVFHGMSMGGLVANLTAKELGQNGKAPQLLLDNPTGQHSMLDPLTKHLPVNPQVIAGFVAESAQKMLTDQNMKSAMQEEKAFLQAMDPLVKRDNPALEFAHPRQSLLRHVAAGVDVYSLFRNARVDTDTVRAYIRQGVADPVSFSLAEFGKVITQTATIERPTLDGEDTREVKAPLFFTEGKSRAFPINASHFINRFRIEKWANNVEFFQKHAA